MKHPFYRSLPGLNRQPHLGLRLPVRPKDLPISDEEYQERLNAFLEEKGRWDPKLGFFGNWARHNRLEEEFCLIVETESQ
jgi:hypothetical protein